MSSDYRHQFDGMTRVRMREKMEAGWKSTETPCGSGSELTQTNRIRRWLPHVVSDYNVRTIADCGAGDLNWIKKVQWNKPKPEYAPFDLVPRHESVTELDITSYVLEEPFDLIICRHVLNHLSPKLALNAIDNFVSSGSGLLLITNCVNQARYWLLCGMKLRRPICEWGDSTKWWCELHDLQSEDLWKVRR